MAKSGKRGRPRRDWAVRTPSGRISRAKDNAMDVALAARIRLYGLSEAQAKDQHAVTVLGRLWLSGLLRSGDEPVKIAEARRMAGEAYVQLRNAAYKAIRAPASLRVGDTRGGEVDLDLLSKEVIDAYETWCDRACARWDEARNALVEFGRQNREIVPLTAVNVIVIEDQDARWLLADLIAGLDVLAGFFGLTKAKQ